MFGVSSAHALELPPGFQARTLPIPKATEAGEYKDGLQKPTTIDFAPDGKMFVAGRSGRVMVFDSVEDTTPTLAVSILPQVHARGDRGLLGMKLDPNYPAEPYFYLLYTYDAPIGGDYTKSTHPHYSDGSDDCVDAEPFKDCAVSGRLVRIELDPTTGVAVGGPSEPPEQVLVNSWCQQFISHSIGDLEFDSEGALLASGGEGANWTTTDYGQFSNPCGDPPDEGGSLRAQDVRTPATAGDPTDYSGSLIRVNPDTGAAMPNNPFSENPARNSKGEEDVAARRILAYGFRNPYRFTVQPGTGEVYIGNVGQSLWEAIDRVKSPPVPGQQALNFGWPCYEGGGGGVSAKQPGWVGLEMPLCEALYEDPSQVTPPFYASPHKGTPGGGGGYLFEGDTCDPSPGAASSGLAFYAPSGVPAEHALPAKDDGALFMADAARGCVWMMRATEGEPDPSKISDFAVAKSSESFTPVDIVEGPDGALYIPNFYDNSIVQVRYFPGNQAPVAKLSVDKTYGAAPLTVKLDASESGDPDGDPLSYEWDLNGDGEFEDGTGPTAERTYSASENVTAKVRVSDPYNHVEVAEVKLFPGDLGPPNAEIKAPSPELEWAVGDDIDYEGSATDPNLGVTPTLHWEFTIRHCPSACHSHPLNSSDSASGDFIAPQHEYPSHLLLELTATDSRGLSDTKSVEIFPRLISVGMNSEPPGIPVNFEEMTAPGPFEATMIAGGSANVSAPATTTVEGFPYVFSEWSDGGARSHQITRLESINLVARYRREQSGSPPSEPAPKGSPGPRSVRFSLASKPPGVSLRVGAVKRVAPFAIQLSEGAHTFIVAPRRMQRGGQELKFNGWHANGRRLGHGRRHEVTAKGDARYLAVYGPSR